METTEYDCGLKARCQDKVKMTDDYEIYEQKCKAIREANAELLDGFRAWIVLYAIRGGFRPHGQRESFGTP